LIRRRVPLGTERASLLHGNFEFACLMKKHGSHRLAARRQLH
jgi:hypothetical protein